MIRARRRLAPALAAALALTLAACSDDDGGDVGGITVPPGPRTHPATAPPATAPATTTAPANTEGSATPTAPGTPSAPTAAPATTAPAPTTAAPAADPVVTPTVVAEVDTPTDLAWRDGDPGLYVTEKNGRVVRLADGQVTTVLDMADLVSTGGEQGLLGIAFAPAGDVAYLNYTDVNGDTAIVEHPVAADGTFLTGDDSRTVLTIDQPYSNHNGGDLTFGPDGYLYIATGDGGGPGDPDRQASNLSSLLGKILRIDPAIADGQPYTVPDDNPFVGTDAAPEVWAAGLRNPWRVSFDRETGDLWIADVGASAREEVNVAPSIEGFDAGRGRNFGWSAFEGTLPHNSDVVVEEHTPPIFEYGHDEGCSISGGVRARGEAAGSLAGWYVFSDNCAGTVWALEVAATTDGFTAGRRVTIAEGVGAPTAVVDGPDGAVYVLAGTGPVIRLDA